MKINGMVILQRERFLQTVMNNEINNVVVLTGDIHTLGQNDLPSEDYLTMWKSQVSLPRITKRSLEAIQALNPHMKYIELKQHGFVL
jgi:alkaline phosphatase D